MLAPLSVFSLLISLAVGLTALFSIILLIFFVRDWRSRQLW